MDSSSYDAGYKVGSMIGAFVPLAFLVLAVVKLFEPQRNRKCALSMILFTAGWSCSTVGYALSKLTGADGLLAVLAFAGLLIVLAGIVFGFLGLIEISGTPKTPVGSTQAVWSLVLSGLFLVTFAVGFIVAMRGRIPDDWKMTQPLPGSRVSVVPKNFSLATPGPDWIQVVPAKLNERADLAFVQPKKLIYVIVLAHPIPAANLTPLKVFTDAARGELKQADAGATVSEARPLTVNGCEGAVFDVDATLQRRKFAYREWVSVQGSVAYQILVWGLQSNATLVRSEADRIIGSFELLTAPASSR